MATLPRHYELHAEATVTSGYLRIACISLAVVSISLAALAYRFGTAASRVQVPIVVVDPTGRAVISNYMGKPYTPGEREIRAWVTQWAINYYSRVRFTLADSYADSLRFFDDKLERAAEDQERSTNWIEAFAHGTNPQITIDVTNVAPGDLSRSPYTARVDFQKVFKADTFAEIKRETWVTDIVFTVHPNPQADRTNPLGIAIHDLREAPAFE